MRLVAPDREHLPSYAAALAAGWSPNNLRDVSGEQLAADPDGFLAEFTRRGGTVTLPDGREVPKLPWMVRWMWDGDFAGSINFRWQPGTGDLPAHVLGHIGYAVVPWKRRRGYATAALGMMLEEARRVGLPYVEVTADMDNTVSRRTIEKNGGRFVETFVSIWGPKPEARYRIGLGDA